MTRRRLYLLILIGSLGCDRDPLPSVRFIEPTDEAVMPGPDLPVALSARNVVIAPAASRAPNTAHHHLFLDLDLTPPAEEMPAGKAGIIHLGKGDSTFVFRDIAPGSHRIIVVLGDSTHIPLEPLVTDTVRFTINDPHD